MPNRGDSRAPRGPAGADVRATALARGEPPAAQPDAAADLTAAPALDAAPDVVLAPPGEASMLAPALDRLRACGVASREPLRWRLVEALARRHASLHGEARRLLGNRLAAAIADCETRLASSSPGPLSPARANGAAEDRAHPGSVVAHSPIASLLDALGASARPGAAPGAAALSAAARLPDELSTLRLHRSTWARLRLDRRLSQSLAMVPQNAGPLNSQQVVHRTLGWMRDHAPAYLQRFVAHVDTLIWLEQVLLAPPAPTGDAGSSAGAPRRRRGRG